MKRRRVVWSRPARLDLELIVSYVAEQSPQAALDLLGRMQAKADSLNRMAPRGRVVPELAALHVREYRELVLAPYRLIYRVADREVLVLGVFDARRNLEDILLDRLIRSEVEDE